jgi:hypothetical protein
VARFGCPPNYRLCQGEVTIVARRGGMGELRLDGVTSSCDAVEAGTDKRHKRGKSSHALQRFRLANAGTSAYLSPWPSGP